MKVVKILGIVAAMFVATNAYSAEFTLCTGKVGGVYNYTGNTLASQVDKSVVTVNVVETLGSGENLDALASGACDGAIVQSDAIFVYNKEKGDLQYMDMGPLYTEFAHLICRRNLNITNLSDLTDKTKIMIGKDGSGSNITFRGLVYADKEDGGDAYSKIPVLNQGGDVASLVLLKGGNQGLACMFAVSAPGGKFIGVDAEKFAGDLVVTPLYDKDFNDVEITDSNGVKSSVWTPVVLEGGRYNKIMPSGVFSNKSVDTVGVNARLIISPKYVEEHPDAFGEIGVKLIDTLKIVQADKQVQLLIK